jgi:uncharacterized membrane protein YGL010W
MAAQPSAEPGIVDQRSELQRWLGSYAEDHRNATNQVIHWICVPLIVWTVVALLWVIPVPPAIGKPGLWAALVAVGAMGFYIRLSKRLAAAIFIAFVAYFVLTHFLFQALGARGLLWTAVAVFVVAWIGQFIGHSHYEGARPTFLRDLTYLLIGPLWLVSKLMRRFHIAY